MRSEQPPQNGAMRNLFEACMEAGGCANLVEEVVWADAAPPRGKHLGRPSATLSPSASG